MRHAKMRQRWCGIGRGAGKPYACQKAAAGQVGAVVVSHRQKLLFNGLVAALKEITYSTN
jgi:hypothetical protein